MRRFELIEGSASKFWEVALSGAELSVRFGRIGTVGQSKTKTFDDAAAALKEHDKLVKEKTGKGYAEVGVAAGAKLAAAATPAPTSPKPAPAPALVGALTPAAPRAEAPPTPPTAAADIPWPQGGFLWTPALRERLPVLRSLRMPDESALWRSLQLDWSQEAGMQYRAQRFQDTMQAAGRSWTFWTAAQMQAAMQAERLQQADIEAWSERLAQAGQHFAAVRSPELPREQTWNAGVAWATEQGLQLHGLNFMLEVGLDLLAVAGKAYEVLRCFQLLRARIARADEAEHQGAIELLEREAGHTPLQREMRAFLCPHRADWVAQALADPPQDGRDWLRECVMPPQDALAYLRRNYQSYDNMVGPLLLQTHLHGAAALPLFAQAVNLAANKDEAEKLLNLMLRLRVPELLPALVGLMARLEARNALDKLAEEFPAATLLCLLQARSEEAAAAALRLALRAPAALQAVRPQLAGSAQLAALEERLAQTAIAEAEATQLPDWLRQPPWLDKQRPAPLPTLALQAPATPGRINWAPGERERHMAYQAHSYVLNRKHSDRVDHLLNALRVLPQARAALREGGALAPEDVMPVASQYMGESPDLALLLPEGLGLSVWNGYPGAQWYGWEGIEAPVRALLARHGEAALPGLLSLAAAQPEVGLRVAQHIDHPGLVPVALAARRLKKARALALDWLRRHPDTAARGALPLAFGADKTAREDAAFALRWLAQQGLAPQLQAAATELGCSEALQALLDFDPMRVLPARLPKLPAFYVPATFRRPLLREGGAALPLASMEAVGLMLAMSTLDAPYAGIERLRALCTPASLAGFAWDLFLAWLSAGAPSKEAWAFQALGLLGDDDTAQRLAPRIREWPGEAAHARAVLGLDVLAAIGSDVALMHLNGIAAKVKFKGLQEKAKEKIAAVAELRGFTPEQLADRLVPELGLDDDGRLPLDFGPRQFFVHFDEALKPFVKDAQGLRLKDLPKPTKSDDAALAEAATERFKQVKKDAKAVAALQLLRLEMAMVAQRRWPVAEFTLFFLQHPLMRHLAARLVWGVYGADGNLSTAFRIAEDWSLADAEDNLFELPADAQIGIAHPLELPASLTQAFGQVFADYEILQPFKQLGRETFALPPAEAQTSELKRFAAKVVATGSVMGLVNRGWERGQAQDAGWIGWFSKALGEEWEAELQLEPGTYVGDLSTEPKQRFPALTLRRRGSWGADGQVAFAQLHPVALSELLRDLELMAPLKE
ncbi:DUF4132 domain-containing protein [Inhella sp.]|uniref:DUF4132 domain-containing protein n=1 Tax=Inhella sp. TaxID=1921806 RepID=UPI0035B1CA3D